MKILPKPRDRYIGLEKGDIFVDGTSVGIFGEYSTSNFQPVMRGKMLTEDGANLFAMALEINRMRPNAIRRLWDDIKKEAKDGDK